MELETKSLQVRVTDAAKGEVEAIFARTGVVDHDRDLTMQDAFTEGAPVVISDYNHSSNPLKGARLPIGRGVIKVTQDEARMVGTLFMKRPYVRDVFETLEGMGDQQEWSYWPTEIQTRRPTADEVKMGAKRVILKVGRVPEVSPVLAGAGIATATVRTKGTAGAESEVPAAVRAHCGCGRLLGESPQELIYVGTVKELSEVATTGPRDVRYCKNCRRHAVFIPKMALTRPAA